jgi:hypothetical protein
VPDRRPTAILPGTGLTGRRTLVSRAVLAVLLTELMVTAACLPGGGLMPPRQVFVSLQSSGGITARSQTVVIRADGTIEIGGQPARTLAGGAKGAADLRDRLVATGIYEVPPGDYLPENMCCDRMTYELTLVRSGKSYRYVTMDATEDAPRPLFSALAAIQEALRSAQ